MSWATDYDNATRFLFFTKVRKNTFGGELYEFGVRFNLVNILGVSYYETLPIAVMPLDVGTATGTRVREFSGLQQVELEQIASYNADKDTPVFEMHQLV